MKEKESKVAELISVLPGNWTTKTLDEVCTVVMGQSPPSSSYNTEGRGLPFFQGKAEFGSLYPETVKWCAEPKKVAKKDDVLISVRAPVGPTNLAPSECCIGRGLAAIRPLDEMPSEYILYYLRSIVSQLEALGTGTTFKAISSPVLKSIPIPIAPLEQQKLIVAEIEKQFSRLDEAVANLKRVKANLKRYKAAVLKAAVEGKLTEQWRTELPDIEPASELLKRILTERRKKWEEDYIKKYVATHGYVPKDDSWKKKYKEPAPPDTSNLAELPKGWAWITIEQVCEVGTGATPLRSKKEYYAHGTIPWVTSAALNELFVNEADEYITELALKETNVKVFPKHTLLVAMYGEGKTRGKVSELMIEAGTNQACAALIFDGISEQIRPYLKLFFQKNYDDIRRLSSGGVQPNLNLGIIKDTLVPLLPIKEQAQMLEIIDQRLSIIYLMGKEINDNLKRAERLRQSILKKAFLGQLISKDQSNERKNNIGKRNV